MAAHRYLLAGGVICLLISMTGFFLERHELAGIAFSLMWVLLALGVRYFEDLKGFSFTLFIFAAVTVAMCFPSLFTGTEEFASSLLIVPLLQIIMFGMGTAMSLKDFEGVLRQPKAVGIGILCQFTIMPLLGAALAFGANFPPEIAAGVILIGCSPSGLASNVMAYLAKANLALSVTLTAVATLLAPIMTPFLMEWLASQYVPIDFLSMMWAIIKIVIIPIAAGLLFNHFFHGKLSWLDKAMPVVSMVSIGIIITIITALGRDNLLTIGAALIIVALVHNIAGYALGYWGCRVFGMDEKTCRTIALEVGMQNGGLASGIALSMGKVATHGLAPAVFGPLMNITGSSLATWWRDRQP